MSDRERLNFTAPEDQVGRWREFLEGDHEYPNFSEFIRTACDNEMKRVKEDSDEQVNQLVNQLSRDIEGKFDAIQEEIQELNSEIGLLRKNLQDETDLNEIAREVRSVLPGSVDEIVHRQTKQEENPDEFVNTATLQDLARTVDAQPSLVQDAITYLRNNFIEVESITIEEGTTHYYRED